MTRKRGRPPLVEGTGSEPASTRLPLPIHDRFLQLARLRRLSPSRLLRELATNYVLKNSQSDHSSLR